MIVRICNEILPGKFREAFIVDPIQGGARKSLNMNANEVIANRAIELLGSKKGDYSTVHPNDHVNLAQSTNDVIPIAGKMNDSYAYEPEGAASSSAHGAIGKGKGI